MLHRLGFVSLNCPFFAVGFAQGVEGAVEIVAPDVRGGAQHSIDAGAVLIISIADSVEMPIEERVEMAHFLAQCLQVEPFVANGGDLLHVEIARHERLELPAGLEGDGGELFAMTPDGWGAFALGRRADLEVVKGGFQGVDCGGDGVEFGLGHGWGWFGIGFAPFYLRHRVRG